MTLYEKIASKPLPKHPWRTNKEKQDESIMSTNNSCIVSKRSVEKIYHKDDNGFLRYFVKKYQRRSPLINRGYWLRMRAVEHVIRTFLKDSTRKKAIVNLGCGYDPLPFKFLAHELDLCHNATFIDVDYHQLMVKKCQIIETTPQLKELIPELRPGLLQSDILLSSEHYKAIACDLEDVRRLDRVMHETLNVDDYAFLFIAEVSMTYMESEAAEAVICWASKLSEAHFCILEQFLPDGPQHPFASTMLKHFSKMQSPIKSALRYPSAANQRGRFLGHQWNSVDMRTLWDLWADDAFVTSEERKALDSVEPFDEWEEFALFASHYFLLVATNKSPASEVDLARGQPEQCSENLSSSIDMGLYAKYHANSKLDGCRRFGAIFQTTDLEMCHHGGYGTQGRLNNSTIYRRAEVNGATRSSTPLCSRDWTVQQDIMCHTITPLDNAGYLLVGGRASPASASSACFLGHEGNWTEVGRLPQGLFRHCAVSTRKVESGFDESAVLVFGGRTGSGEVLDTWLHWDRALGWQEVEVITDRPPARFGACLSTSPHSLDKGFLCGGMSEEGKVLADWWAWELLHDSGIKVRCTNLTPQLEFPNQIARRNFARFGATLFKTADEFLLIGGISSAGVIPLDMEVVKISTNLEVTMAIIDTLVPRPMLIGCGISRTNDGLILLVGGGAVCFSFGTFWNEGSYVIATGSSAERSTSWCLFKQSSIEQKPWNNIILPITNGPTVEDWSSGSQSSLQASRGKVIEKSQVETAERFEAVVRKGLPVILRGFDIGRCTEVWDGEYLKRQVGEDRPVVVHSAASSKMNFLEKNFTYTTLPFGQFLDKVGAGEQLYLRSLSSSQPADRVTNLSEDFTSIAADFVLPPQMQYAQDNAHSSPFRISGPVTMWLHYDVMANLLCQISGEKRLVLFPPSDINHLEFPPGATSSRLNIFDAKGEAEYVHSTHPVHFELKPGDVLFIPSLWAHTATPTKGVSIAVNVFFRNLESGYAAGKDVYGNRDLHAYENGRRDISRMSRAFRNLPREVGEFYMRRLAQEMMEVADSWGDAR